MKRHFIIVVCTFLLGVSLGGCGIAEKEQEIRVEVQKIESETQENFIDFAALGITKYSYPAEFVLGEDLQAAITVLSLCNDTFDDRVVETEDWKSTFIARFIQNSRFSFAYLNQVAEEKEGEIGVDELNYIQYSLTGRTIDFSAFVDGTVNVKETSSTINYGWITEWTFETVKDEVVLTAMLEVGYGGLREEDLEERKVEVKLKKNPYSCFDGYSIQSLSTEIITPWVAEVPEENIDGEKEPENSNETEVVKEVENEKETEDAKEAENEKETEDAKEAENEKETEDAKEAEYDIEVELAELEKQEQALYDEMNAIEFISQMDMNMTSAAVYKLWDDELNVVWSRLQEKLSEEEFEILREEQRQWIKDRDIEMDKLREEEWGSAGTTIVNGLGTDMTKERISVLITYLD